MNDLRSERAIITLGGDGLISFDGRKNALTPALGSSVVDKVGAGDSVFAMGSLLSFLKAPLEVVGLICNIVASHEISQLGHRTSLEIGDIKKQVKSILS
jgi:sugar/nucleoside kinase (ribokinase family)